MSDFNANQSEKMSWLLFKWWVAPFLAVLGGFFLGALLRHGSLTPAAADNSTPYTVEAASENTAG